MVYNWCSQHDHGNEQLYQKLEEFIHDVLDDHSNVRAYHIYYAKTQYLTKFSDENAVVREYVSRFEAYSTSFATISKLFSYLVSVSI